VRRRIGYLAGDFVVDGRQTARQLLARRGATVFMSSHVMSEVQQTADRVGIISDGRLLAVESVDVQTGGAATLAVTTVALAGIGTLLFTRRDLKA
jgi:ABC-type Na+ transport system ATPase subunit NatA